MRQRNAFCQPREIPATTVSDAFTVNGLSLRLTSIARDGTCQFDIGKNQTLDTDLQTGAGLVLCAVADGAINDAHPAVQAIQTVLSNQPFVAHLTLQR